MEKRSRSRMRSSQSKSSPKKINSGRVTRNPFLNFLRDFRKSNKHKYDVCELTRRGAQLWRGMTQREKSPYVNLSKQAPKYKKTRKGRRRRRRKKRRRRKSRSRSSSIMTGESTDRCSADRDRRRRGDKRDDKRREERHSHSHSHSRDTGGRKENTSDKRQENKERSNSREKRNQEYELKYKNSKYEDTRDFI